MGEFREYIFDAIAHGMRLAALFCQPVDERRARLWAVLADDSRSLLIPLRTETEGSYPSLTPQCPQAHWFEREIFEQYAVKPRGSSVAQAHPIPCSLPTQRRMRTRPRQPVKSG